MVLEAQLRFVTAHCSLFLHGPNVILLIIHDRIDPEGKLHPRVCSDWHSATALQQLKGLLPFQWCGIAGFAFFETYLQLVHSEPAERKKVQVAFVMDSWVQKELE